MRWVDNLVLVILREDPRILVVRKAGQRKFVLVRYWRLSSRDFLRRLLAEVSFLDVGWLRVLLGRRDCRPLGRSWMLLDFGELLRLGVLLLMVRILRNLLCGNLVCGLVGMMGLRLRYFLAVVRLDSFLVGVVGVPEVHLEL